MRIVLATLLITCGFFPMVVSASPFLNQSDFLKANKMKLLIAEVRGNKVLVMPLKGQAESTKKFLLGNDGTMHQLTGSLSREGADKIDTGCGNQSNAVTLTFKASKPVRGEFVLVGGDMSQQVHWYPSDPIAKAEKPGCISYKPDFKLKNFALYKTKGNTENTVYFADWDFVGKAKKGTGACGLIAAETVGLIGSVSSKCLIFNTLERDCDGMAIGKVKSAREFIGLLTLKDENWFIFRSEGYESTGYTAISMTDDQGVDKRRQEELHNSGC